ncbi:hypothetical protein MPSEU_000303000 [Mayamaea pseudoterrestris]|nr:hypothetical protein MPSEU_000303000 [Mayamaea pseudoterrestris]
MSQVANMTRWKTQISVTAPKVGREPATGLAELNPKDDGPPQEEWSSDDDQPIATLAKNTPKQHPAMNMLKVQLAKLKEEGRLQPGGYLDPRVAPSKMKGKGFRRPTGTPPDRFDWIEKRGLWKLRSEYVELLQQAGLMDFYFPKPKNVQSAGKKQTKRKIETDESMQDWRSNNARSNPKFRKQTYFGSSGMVLEANALARAAETEKIPRKNAVKQAAASQIRSWEEYLEGVVESLIYLANIDNATAQRHLGRNATAIEVAKVIGRAQNAYHILWNHKDGCHKYEFLTKTIQRVYAANPGDVLSVTITSLKMMPDDWSSI